MQIYIMAIGFASKGHIVDLAMEADVFSSANWLVSLYVTNYLFELIAQYNLIIWPNYLFFKLSFKNHFSKKLDP